MGDAFTYDLTSEMSEAGRQLVELFEGFSNDGYCAGWMLDIEHEAYEWMLAGKPVTYGHGEVTADDIARMRALSEQLGGWVRWRESDDPSPVGRFIGTGARFVAAGDWAELHEAWKRRQGAGVG